LIVFSKDISIGKTQKGEFTFLSMHGVGACGQELDTATDKFVSVNHNWWTTANANDDDPLCGYYVDVTWQGKSLTLPIHERCPSNVSTHLDLSELEIQLFN